VVTPQAPDIAANPTAASLSQLNPDWAKIPDEVLCPLCDYNMRGLTHPQCPECGYRFDWPELLDPHRRAHPFIFEHHAERNIWSFGKTLLTGLHAATFWRSLYPTQPSRPKRILIYALLTALPIFLTWMAYALAMTELAFARYKAMLLHSFGGPASAHLPSISLLRIRIIFQNATRHDNLLTLGLAVIVWPWLTLAGLTIFQSSMKRAKINRVHMLRCLVYSADLLLVVFPFYFWLVAEACGFDTRFFFLPGTLSRLWIAAVSILLLTFIYRLVCAYRIYLRFDHTVVTILATQVLTALAVWKLILVVQGY
jgi:hypothetical protein